MVVETNKKHFNRTCKKVKSSSSCSKTFFGTWVTDKCWRWVCKKTLKDVNIIGVYLTVVPLISLGRQLIPFILSYTLLLILYSFNHVIHLFDFCAFVPLSFSIIIAYTSLYWPSLVFHSSLCLASCINIIHNSFSILPVIYPCVL